MFAEFNRTKVSSIETYIQVKLSKNGVKIFCISDSHFVNLVVLNLIKLNNVYYFFFYNILKFPFPV